MAGLYPDKKRWRRMLDASPVRVQWDPDYDINDVRQPRRVIQVGIVPPMVAVYGKLPVKIRDITQEVHRIHGLVQSGQIASAKKLLPVEMPYPLSPSIRRVLAMALKP